MKLYVVRHGQTEINVNNCLQGRIDCDLTDVGIEQSYQIASKLKDKHIDLILTSPLKRCKSMAEIIGRGEIPIRVDVRLLGRDHGEFTGPSRNEVPFSEYWNYYKNIHYERAENIQDLYHRVGECICELKRDFSDKTVLLVTHSGFIRVLYYYMNGIPDDGVLSEITIENGQIFEYNL